MMKLKFLISVFLICLLFLFSITSCQPKDKFEWNAGISAPKNYIAGGPFVEFFFDGKSIAGTSSNTGINPGWGNTSGGYTGGEKYKPVPDSVVINWRCGVDLIEYKIGAKLPREKMLELFKNKYVAENGSKGNYTQIVTGFAPGGNIVIWLTGGRINKEIIKLKANPIKEYNPYDSESVTLWTSTGEEAKEIFKYLYIHGLSYKIWETGEKEYDYDIGFASEGNNIKPDIVTFRSKDGSWYQPQYIEGDIFSIDKMDYQKFKYIENNNKLRKIKLPVEIEFEFENNNKYYSTNIVLPNDFEKYFSKSDFDRIVIGIKKDGTDGIIWVEGKNERREVMRFKVFEAKNDEMKSYIPGGYSLPKNFQFPKWEGRIPILKPTDFDYWQEK